MFTVRDCEIDYKRMRKILNRARLDAQARIKNDPADVKAKQEWLSFNHAIELLDNEQVEKVRKDLGYGRVY